MIVIYTTKGASWWLLQDSLYPNSANKWKIQCTPTQDTYTIKPDLHKRIKYILFSENKHYSQCLKTKHDCQNPMLMLRGHQKYSGWGMKVPRGDVKQWQSILAPLIGISVQRSKTPILLPCSISSQCKVRNQLLHNRIYSMSAERECCVIGH